MIFRIAGELLKPNNIITLVKRVRFFKEGRENEITVSFKFINVLYMIKLLHFFLFKHHVNTSLSYYGQSHPILGMVHFRAPS